MWELIAFDRFPQNCFSAQKLQLPGNRPNQKKKNIFCVVSKWRPNGFVQSKANTVVCLHYPPLYLCLIMLFLALFFFFFFFVVVTFGVDWLSASPRSPVINSSVLSKNPNFPNHASFIQVVSFATSGCKFHHGERQKVISTSDVASIFSACLTCSLD